MKPAPLTPHGNVHARTGHSELGAEWGEALMPVVDEHLANCNGGNFDRLAANALAGYGIV